MAGDSRALRRAAGVILAALRRHSPSAKVASSFVIARSGDGLRIVSRESGAWATDNPPQGSRHPLFGNRLHWYNTNQRHPERTGWSERAAEDSADRAAEVYVDELLSEYGFEDAAE